LKSFFNIYISSSISHSHTCLRIASLVRLRAL
jgi:hypothetical protein